MKKGQYQKFQRGNELKLLIKDIPMDEVLARLDDMNLKTPSGVKIINFDPDTDTSKQFSCPVAGVAGEHQNEIDEKPSCGTHGDNQVNCFTCDFGGDALAVVKKVLEYEKGRTVSFPEVINFCKEKLLTKKELSEIGSYSGEKLEKKPKKEIKNNKTSPENQRILKYFTRIATGKDVKDNPVEASKVALNDKRAKAFFESRGIFDKEVLESCFVGYISDPEKTVSKLKNFINKDESFKAELNQNIERIKSSKQFSLIKSADEKAKMIRAEKETFAVKKLQLAGLLNEKGNAKFSGDHRVCFFGYDKNKNMVNLQFRYSNLKKELGNNFKEFSHSVGPSGFFQLNNAQNKVPASKGRPIKLILAEGSTDYVSLSIMLKKEIKSGDLAVIAVPGVKNYQVLRPPLKDYDLIPKGSKIIIALDNDPAGKAGTRKLAEFFNEVRPDLQIGEINLEKFRKTEVNDMNELLQSLKKQGKESRVNYSRVLLSMETYIGKNLKKNDLGRSGF